MSEEHGDEEVTSGRLAAEDRRGRVLEPMLGDPRRGLGAESDLDDPDPETAWSEEKPTSRVTKILVMSCLFLLLISGGFAVYFVQEKEEIEVASPVSHSQPEKTFMEKASAEEVEVAVRDAIQTYMSAKTHAERCEVILGGQAKLPLLEEYDERSDTVFPEGFGGKLKTEPYAVGGEPALAALADDLDPRKLWLFIVRSTATGMEIDWEASVAYGEKPWLDFIYQQPESLVQMRVYLEGIRAPLSEKIDEDAFRTFAVTAKGYEFEKFLHVERSSELGKSLAKMVPHSSKQPVNIRLRWVEGEGGKKSLDLVEILHNYWITPQEQLSPAK